MKRQISTFLFMTALATLSLHLTGCGVKPGSVEPPSGAEEDGTFPRTYPDLGTDPK
jgi:predicted small lipoprotein YifL